MLYRFEKMPALDDFCVKIHKYRNRSGEWAEERRIHFSTWPGGEVGNCPYTVSEVERATRDRLNERESFEALAIERIGSKAIETGESVAEWVSRQPDYRLHQVIRGEQ